MENYFNEMKSWTPLSKMDDASPELYAERIKKAYECILPHKDLTIIPYIGLDEVIDYDYPELIGLCPVTFFPDVYRVRIRFIPDGKIPELKSLKLYYMDYISVPISHEHLASKIYKEFCSQVSPKQCYLELFTNVRGGLTTNITIGELF
jgi:7-cyano-7-deazaguanine reductase